MSKVIIVTGASRGIGRNIAYNLAVNGYRVIANYNNSETEAQKLKQQIEDKGLEIDLFKANVSKRSEVKKLVDYVIEKYGRIDVLINNAGIAEQKLFTDITDEDFDRMMKVNLYSAFYTTQETSRYMIREHEGCIINISSIYALTGGSCEVHYSMAKAGLDGMTKALARELGPNGIRVNAVAPGVVATDMMSIVTDEMKQGLLRMTPLNKMADPTDLAGAYLYLASDLSKFTTGTIIQVDGGLVM